MAQKNNPNTCRWMFRWRACLHSVYLAAEKQKLCTEVSRVVSKVRKPQGYSWYARKELLHNSQFKYYEEWGRPHNILSESAHLECVDLLYFFFFFTKRHASVSLFGFFSACCCTFAWGFYSVWYMSTLTRNHANSRNLIMPAITINQAVTAKILSAWRT